MEAYLSFSQILVASLLIVCILVQVKGMGTGLFGGGESTFRTRRGSERTVFRLTIALGILFVIVSILSFQLR